MKVYKLTNNVGQTYNCCQWGESVTNETSGTGDLCGPGWLHYYEDARLAVLLNPIHAEFHPDTMQLWEAKADGQIKRDRGLKAGCSRLTTLRRIPLPEVTTEHRIRFGIACARRVCTDKVWQTWATKWLSGEDRSEDAALYAAGAAATAATASAAATVAALAAALENVAKFAAEAAVYAAAVANELPWNEILQEVFETP